MFSQFDGNKDFSPFDGIFYVFIAVRSIRDSWKTIIGNYPTSLIGEILFDLQGKLLLGIILLPLLARFSLICRMGLPNYPFYRPLGQVDWAFVLGWRQGLGCFIGLASSLGLASGPARLFFKPHHDPFRFAGRLVWMLYNLKVSSICTTDR